MWINRSKKKERTVKFVQSGSNFAQFTNYPRWFFLNAKCGIIEAKKKKIVKFVQIGSNFAQVTNYPIASSSINKNLVKQSRKFGRFDNVFFLFFWNLFSLSSLCQQLCLINTQQNLWKMPKLLPRIHSIAKLQIVRDSVLSLITSIPTNVQYAKG